MICILDHQDSFTYNIYALLLGLGAEVEVLPTAKTSLQMLLDRESEISAFILSPGPGHPDDAKLFYQVLGAFAGKRPILGVCLGHQAIAQHYGGYVRSCRKILHGKSVWVEHDRSELYNDISSPFLAMRYNSLEVESSLSTQLIKTAWCLTESQKSIMGLKHRVFDIFGVQFHPESVGTPDGIVFLKNFLHWTQKKII